MIKNCTAVILAGGESKRMGEDKAQINLNGVMLFERTLAQVKPLFESVMISSRETRHHHDEVEILDIATDCRGPIVGIISCLAHIQTEWAFVVACDMPFIQPNLIRYLCHHRQPRYDCIVPVVGGKPQPLFALYRKPVLSLLIQAAQQGHCSLVRNMHDAFNTYWIEEDKLKTLDENLVSFVDIDTPEDLAFYQKSL